MNLLVADTLADCLCNDINTLVVHNFQSVYQLFLGKSAEVIASQTVHMLFQ